MKHIYLFTDNQKDNITYFKSEIAYLVTMNIDDMPYLKEQDFADYSGIYVLIGDNKRYIGQACSCSISKRLSTHIYGGKKDWIQSILFFCRTDGKMSKFEADYLEKKLIFDFFEKSEFDLDNSTSGNSSYIDSLQKAMSDSLYYHVLGIVEDIANIDLFGTNVMNDQIGNEDKSLSTKFELEFNDLTFTHHTARGVFLPFMKYILNESKYSDVVRKNIVDDSPSVKYILGTKVSTYKGQPNSIKLEDQVWLYVNLSRKTVLYKINKLAEELNIKLNVKSWG